MASIKHKRSAVPGKIPTALQLAAGEIAVNTADKLLYIKDSSNSVVAINDWANIANKPVDFGGSGSGRELLTEPRTYYVSTTGNNANNGLTAGTPFQTIQHAVNVVQNLDLGTHNVIIQLADGSYAENVLLRNTVGAGLPIIRGNLTTPGNVSLTAAAGSTLISVNRGGMWNVQGMSFTGGAIHLACDGLSSLSFRDVRFGAASGSHIVCYSGRVQCTGSYTITAAASAYHINVTGTAADYMCSGSGFVVTVNSNPVFNTFLNVSTGGTATFFGTTFSGAASGKRYNVELNAAIQTFGAGASFIPGNAAGTAVSGGQYA